MKEVGLFASRAMWGLLSWPTFSLTSFRMVTGLRKQGIDIRTCIDVGANVGQFAIASAKLWRGCNVESFEPLSDCAATMRANCQGLPVNIHEFAVGDRDCEVQLHVNAHRHSSSVMSLASAHLKAFPFAREETTITVKLARLDTFFRGRKFERPVLLKLDVQGYEPQALKGAEGILDQIDFVLMETSFRPLYQGELIFAEILPMMVARGFRFLRPVDWLEDPKTGEILQMDALFERVDNRTGITA